MKYMGSKNRIAKYILPIILKDRKPDQYFVDCFCLSADTKLFTKTGVVEIQDISVGDYIYNDVGTLSKVVSKHLSSKTTGIEIKLNGGIILKSTVDHPFYDKENIEIKGYDLLNKSLLIGTSSCFNVPILDMGDVITISKNTRYGRSGVIYDNSVKVSHIGPEINRFIPVTEKLMYLYGLVCAEGSAKSLTFHQKEESVAKKFIEDYLDIINAPMRGKCFYKSNKNMGLMVTIPYAAIYERLFFDMMGLNHGSRNRNISFLFKLPNNLVLSALKGMYFGDGSCSLKINNSRSLNYKTSSETLARQLQCLLSIKFGIKSTLSIGMNKERYCEGRILQPSNYFNVGVHLDKDISFILGEPSKGIVRQETQQGYVVKKITPIDDTFYDITLENGSSHRYILEGGIVTHNCGGANLIDKVDGNRIGSDTNYYLIELLKALQNDWIPPYITLVEFNDIKCNKHLYPPYLVEYAGFQLTFSSLWFGSYRRDNIGIRDYSNEAISNVMKQMTYLKDISFYNCSYDKLDIPENSIIYCDPPYRNTTGYNGNTIDYEQFYQWCRDKKSEGHTIFVSEYNMPDDFICVWEKEINSSLTKDTGSKKAIEKLFTL